MANELSYVNYDFDELVQQLIDRVKNRDAWKDTYRSGTGQMLIELYAYVANLVLYYTERRAEESYINTAKHRSSILNLVRLINYKPKRPVSALGNLEFTITPISKKVFIPKYTSAQTASGTKYLVAEDVVIMAGNATIEANGVQGEVVELSRLANGEANQTYAILDTQVENTNVFVYVDGELWTEVSSSITSISTSKTYVVRYELDDTITILFGDGVFGKVPPAGSTVRVQYIKSSGLDGNVYELDKVTTLNSVIYDEDGATVDTIVTNSALFLGGDAAEDTEEIRREAPLVFKTGDRAVTKEDFISILENFAGVANANAWGENEESAPNYDMFNKVNLVVLLQNWQLPDSVFKADLSAHLYTKSMMTVKYEYITPEILLVVPTIQLKILKNFSLSDVQSNVEDALSAQFVLGTTSRLAVAKRISDLYAVMEAITGVSYSHMVLEIKQILASGYSGTPTYDFGGTIEALPVKEGSVKVYDGSTLIGHDNGSGGIVGESGGPTVSGAIVYATGLVGVDITPTPTDPVSVRYQQLNTGTDINDIITTKKQVCKLSSVDVTSISYVA